ncbi:hypothetical protein C8F04DRAFT_1183151 [Mycena alexandri]|uniref:Uncharacterized protein n=1 Tax=Mycena alexandri TaxID=1745969 RepID=A0AAD6X4I7_9AGAR|nr:hypothetical protein C8F04DRAFT_1183151 [Mycena alexandri]
MAGSNFHAGRGADDAYTRQRGGGKEMRPSHHKPVTRAIDSYLQEHGRCCYGRRGASPPATLSGVIYLAGVPCTGDVRVTAFQTSAAIFTDKLVAQPDKVPYSVKCLYLGHSLTPEILSLSLSRPMDAHALWSAGMDELPLLILHGTLDAERAAVNVKTVADVLQPHLIRFTKQVGGKARLSRGVKIREVDTLETMRMVISNLWDDPVHQLLCLLSNATTFFFDFWSGFWLSLHTRVEPGVHHGLCHPSNSGWRTKKEVLRRESRAWGSPPEPRKSKLRHLMFKLNFLVV